MTVMLRRRVISNLVSPHLIAAYIGVVVSILLVGAHSIWPTNVDWLAQGDLASTQTAWNYFRHTSIAQWPPTIIENYGNGWNTFYMSAGGNLPLGIPFRFFNAFLPSSFQFIGIWTCLCFALQGFFAAKIINLYISSKVLIVFLASNFLVAPIFIYRIGYMTHSQLGAQWILLCAIYLFLSKKGSSFQWASLVAISLLIEMYMSIMVLTMLLAFVFSRVISSRSKDDKIRSILILVPSFFVSLALLGLLGFFSLPGGISGEGFFRYSSTSLFDPRVSSTSSASLAFNYFNDLSNEFHLLPNGESFLFLGTGVVFFGLFFALRDITKLRRIRWRFESTLILVCLGMFAVGLSNKVAFGTFEVSYWWPQVFSDLRQVVRAATRFGWPLYYLICIYVCKSVVAISARKFLRYVLAVLLISMNVVDQSPLLTAIATKYRFEQNRPEKFRTEMKTIFNDFSELKIFPVFDLQLDNSTKYQSEVVWRNSPNLRGLLLAASELDKQINFSYQSRPVGSIIDIENQRMVEKLTSGGINEGELYIFATHADFMRFSSKFSFGVKTYFFEDLFLAGIPN
jgi:hypothetical protein